MSRTIPLSRGLVAIVDDRDYEELLPHKWTASGNGYAYRTFRVRAAGGFRQKTVLMHRQLLGLRPGDGYIGDHVNGDTLDNRRCNLRAVTASQNSANSILRRNNTSGAKGVHWVKNVGKWNAVIWMSGERFNLGYFRTFEEAAAARKKAEIEKHGDYARGD